MTQHYKKHEKINWKALPTDYTSRLQKKEKFTKLKPIWVLLLGAVFFGIFSIIVSLAGIVIGNTLYPEESFAITNLAQHPTLKDGSLNPVYVITNLIVIILLIPSLALSMKIFGLGGLKPFTSVAGKIRWNRIKAFLPWTLLAVLIIYALRFVITIITNGAEAAIGTVTFMPIMILLIIILAPIQGAAEEYVFRGFALQTFSSWIPLLVIPLILQAVIFAITHAQYNILGLIFVGFSGLVMGYLTIKTGGLEAAFCLHAVNNVFAFITSSTFSAFANTADVTFIDFISSIAISAGCGLLILWTAKRKEFLLK